MKKISLDNGQSYMEAHEAVSEIMANDLWDRVARFMDADTRETVHAEFAPCTEEEFLTEYLRRAPCDLVVDESCDYALFLDADGNIDLRFFPNH